MTKVSKFSSKVCSELKHYVYAYYDPRNGKPFYIGQGCDNRVFSHLSEISDTKKVRQIDELRELGLSPNIFILRHGLQPDEAKIVESVAIDLLGVDNLTNLVSGHHARKFGKMAVDEVVRRYDAEKAEISEPSILIRINKTYKPGMSDRELYEITRSCWKVARSECDKVDYAMPVYEGVIMEVYRVETWLPGGSTFGDDCHGERNLDKLQGRLEFVGRIAYEMRPKYVGKSVSHIWTKGAQNPFRYLNI